MGNINWALLDQTKGLSSFMEIHKDMEMVILTVVESERYSSASCLWTWKWHIRIITILSLILRQFILFSFKNYLHRWLSYIHEWAVLFIFCFPALIFLLLLSICFQWKFHHYEPSRYVTYLLVSISSVWSLACFINLFPIFIFCPTPHRH